MAEPLKNMYNKELIKVVSDTLLIDNNSFDSNGFSRSVFDSTWEDLELKQRLRRIANVLHQYIPGSYKEQIVSLLKMIKRFNEKDIKEEVIEFMFIPDFLEVYGLEDFETSISAMETITQFTSCEFAVRPFIIEYEQKMLDRLTKWSKSKNFDVRRLATEGCRPRLPWAMALPSFKKDPKPILPILSRLKDDVSEYVRRSVANNLNDISKDNPELLIKLVKPWQGKSAELDWVVKHACRTLLKKGDIEVMRMFGFGEVSMVNVDDFTMITKTVAIGGSCEFEFLLINNSDSDMLIRLEYGLYYQKANGTLSRKVFTISEKVYENGSETLINRKQSFKLITTRKFYVGLHQVSLILNGEEMKKYDFHVKM